MTTILKKAKGASPSSAQPLNYNKQQLNISLILCMLVHERP